MLLGRWVIRQIYIQSVFCVDFNLSSEFVTYQSFISLLTRLCYTFSFASHTLHWTDRRADQSFRFDAGVKLTHAGLSRWLPSLKQADWSCHVCVPLPDLCLRPSWRAARLFDTEEDSCTWFEGPATKHFTFLWKRMKTCGISITSERQAKQLK